MTALVPVHIGLGSNMGDARATVLAAIESCRQIANTRVLKASSLYRSAPVESSGDDFVNAVVAAETSLTPLQLLAALQQIEAGQGRQRPYRNAPRTLDLDLLLYDQQQIDLPGLTVPHPRMHLRAFVLLPLLELEPSVRIPGVGLAEHWLAKVVDQRVARFSD